MIGASELRKYKYSEELTNLAERLEETLQDAIIESAKNKEYCIISNFETAIKIYGKDVWDIIFQDLIDNGFKIKEIGEKRIIEW